MYITQIHVIGTKPTTEIRSGIFQCNLLRQKSKLPFLLTKELIVVNDNLDVKENVEWGIGFDDLCNIPET